MNNFQCYNVVDGDTFDVTPSWLYQGTSGPRVRIANVNAPELRQPGGLQAKTKLENAVLGKHVQLQARTVSYGRLVADVRVGELDIAGLLR